MHHGIVTTPPLGFHSHGIDVKVLCILQVSAMYLFEILLCPSGQIFILDSKRQ
jgi:hypothetical protein